VNKSVHKTQRFTAPVEHAFYESRKPELRQPRNAPVVSVSLLHPEQLRIILGEDGLGFPAALLRSSLVPTPTLMTDFSSAWAASGRFRVNP
jgi:hypothetical protein